MEVKEDTSETQPLLKPAYKSEPRVPTKNIFLPLGMFFMSIGLQIATATTQQFVYNYTSSLNPENNDTLQILATNNSEPKCGNKSSSTHSESGKEAANWLLYFELVEYSVGLPVIALAGIYSDFYGRKNFLLLSSLGEAIKNSLIFCIVYFRLDIIYMLIPYGLCGLTGTFYTFYIAANTSIADTTEGGKSRSINMLLVYVYIGLGSSMAGIGTGYLIHLYGFGIPLAIASGAIFVTCIVVNFERETFTIDKRPMKPPLVDTFLRFFAFFRGRGYRQGNFRWKFLITLVSLFILLSPLTSLGSLETLYELGEPFCFTSEMIGYFSAVTEAAHLVLGTLLVKLLHFCIYDEAIAIIGMSSGVVFFMIFAFSKAAWMIFMGTATGVLAIIPLTIIRSILSKFVSSDYQGALFSLIYFLEAICHLVANTVFLTIFGQTQNIMRGFVFLVMTGFYTIGAMFLIPVAISNSKDRKREIVEISVQKPGSNAAAEEARHV